ncbi:hypothetical protein C478_07392 [Natrinema thermotolerans DSM 11552]|nr:hypothetical protein C478_07392 [Natrinema thermotolerans DSM 11552]
MVEEPRFDGIVTDVIYSMFGKGIDAVHCDECGSAIILTNRSGMTVLDDDTDENGLILTCDCQYYPIDDLPP